MRDTSNPSYPTAAVTGCVRGRVQGVSFRYSMQREAVKLYVTGWVRNLPDRTVQFHAEGSLDAVESLLEWCRSGPSFARVEEVEISSGEVSGFASFEILP